MKTLFLASQIDQALPKLYEVLPRSPESLRLLYVKTAKNLESDPVEMSGSFQALRAFGFQIDIYDFADTTAEETAKALGKVDVLFVAGGNTYYLLDQIKKSDLEKVLTAYVEQGNLYIGSSAGSIITCRDIAYIDALDEAAAAPTLSSTQGLGWCPVDIVPHIHDPRFEPHSSEILKQHKRKDIIGLSNEHAVIVHGDSWKVV